MPSEVSGLTKHEAPSAGVVLRRQFLGCSGYGDAHQRFRFRLAWQLSGEYLLNGRRPQRPVPVQRDVRQEWIGGDSHGAARQAKIAVPDSVTINQVSGATVADWDVEDGRLLVTFLEPVEHSVKFTLGGETRLAREGPLAIPLLSGPGSIATVMVLMGKGKTWVWDAPVLAAIWVCAILTLGLGVYPAPVLEAVRSAVPRRTTAGRAERPVAAGRELAEK